METVGHSQDPNVQHSVVSLEIEGTVKLEGPGLTEVTLRGEGRDIVLSVPSARQARRLLGRADVRRLFKTSPALLDWLVRSGLRLKVEVGQKTLLTSKLVERFRRKS